jgi:colicin import membrane protein
MEEPTGLIVVSKVNPTEVFVEGKYQDLLSEIERRAKDFTMDLSTVSGRKEIASMAYQVARSKTFLDNVGKDLSSDLTSKLNKLNGNRKKIREFLDDLKEEVRQPLTVWEEEQKKVEAEEKARNEFEAAWESAIVENELINQRKEAERLKAEVERLEAERQAKEEAERQAREEAERKAKEEAERKAREERIAREAEERAKREAEERVRMAEEEAIRRAEEARLAAEKAERDRVEAAERAERDKQEAVEAERRRAAEEAEMQERARLEVEAREQERIEAERREQERIAADRSHRAKVNLQAAMDLSEHALIGEELAKVVIKTIAKGLITRVSISY